VQLTQRVEVSAIFCTTAICLGCEENNAKIVAAVFPLGVVAHKAMENRDFRHMFRFM